MQFSQCCGGFGNTGKKSTGGGDCVLLPGAVNTASAVKIAAMCGGKGGLVTTSNTTSKTLCSKLIMINQSSFCS